MKHLFWIAVPLLLVPPLPAQQEDMPAESPQEHEWGAPASEQPGNQQWGGRANPTRNPLERIEEVLSKAGVPLSGEQKKTLHAMMDEQRETMRQRFQQMRERPEERRGGNPQMRQQGEAFQEKLLATLTPEQQDVWKKHQTDQIRERGGYPALRLALQEAGAPLTPEQEGPLQAAFREYNEQRQALRRAAGEGNQPDPAKLKELDREHLPRLTKLLEPAQRRALIEWYRNSQKQSN